MSDTETNIPSDIEELLRERVRSLDRLLVLLLVQSEPSRTWYAAEVASSLKISEESVEPILEKLVAAKLFVVEPVGKGVRFAPDPPSLVHQVTSLAEFYHGHAGDVLVFMSNMAIARVRNAALRTFSEAFRIERSKKKDG